MKCSVQVYSKLSQIMASLSVDLGGCVWVLGGSFDFCGSEGLKDPEGVGMELSHTIHTIDSRFADRYYGSLVLCVFE